MISPQVFLLDVGNTLCKCARLDASGQLTDLGSIATHSTLPNWIAFFDKLSVQPMDAVFGVCVAGNQTKAHIESALKANKPTWLTGLCTLEGMSNDYGTPSTLGPDRYLAAYGVCCMQTIPSSFVLATFGTATTVDAVTWSAPQNRYRYEGGLILPGLKLMLSSLNQGTAELPRVETELNTQAASIPKTTQQALLHGAITAQAGAVEKFYGQVTAQNILDDNKARPLHTVGLYISGGNMRHIAPHLPPLVTPISNPVMQGLARYAKQYSASMDTC